MKKLCGLFFFLFLLSSAFATTIYTEEKRVYGPIGAYDLVSVRANSLGLNGQQLVMSVQLGWEAWHDPRNGDPRYSTTTADLAFNDVVYNRGSKEFFYQDQRIGYIKKKCHWWGCSTRLILDHDYQLFVSHNGIGSSAEVTGTLRLLDGR